MSYNHMNRDTKSKIYIEEMAKLGFVTKQNSAFSIFNGEQEGPESGDIELDNKFISYQISKEEKLLCAHFTSMTTLFNILNSGVIRMYNCDKMNDSTEIERGIEFLDLAFNSGAQKNAWLKEQRRQHFLLSMSLYQGTTSDHLWENYGDNHKGVAIVFEFDEEFNSWSNILLHQIHYSDENPSDIPIYQYAKNHFALDKKLKLFQNIPSTIPFCTALVKDATIWKKESEFRLLTRCDWDYYNSRDIKAGPFHPNNPWISPSLKHEIAQVKKDNGCSDYRKVSYLEIPINNENRKKFLKYFTPDKRKQLEVNGTFDDEYFVCQSKTIPRLKIAKIIFGKEVRKNRDLHYSLLDLERFIHAKIENDFEREFL